MDIHGADPFGFDTVDLSSLRQLRSMKWRAYPPDVLPAWVAEMDLGTAPAVVSALSEAVARQDFGYAVDLQAPELTEAFCGFAARRFSWPVDPARVFLLRDVMRGLELWIEGFTRPGDGVVVTTPVYYPFLHAITEAGRVPVQVPAVCTSDRWELDLERLEATFAAGNTLLLLCNPHNPVGRAYTRSELTALAELTVRHDVRVVADEIHAPLVYAPAVHVPFVSLGAEVASRTLTLHSASKAFNLAGLHAAVAVVGSAADGSHLESISYRRRGAAGILGIEASVAAFTYGDEWLDALLVHLAGVRDHLGAELAARVPGVSWFSPEATYLAWLDCSGLGLGPSPQSVFLEEGRVAFSDGVAFGDGGAGFVRLNFGTSRAILSELVSRMVAAL
ncbi:MalY/PatB family protein [Sporichthya sp.]|uniref:MalY/PatB family protein n=1 Tax=Sporichthya sp. TaxID=65475 RepID=UPI0018127D14|nr:PatB family C-S lyase [Sporichthya sp.]MBA3742321.1 putative C-S lyase [Sporichthya sp.]